MRKAFVPLNPGTRGMAGLTRAAITAAMILSAGCLPPRRTLVEDCRAYRPSQAKPTFDGRVGQARVRNASSLPAQIKVFHPDGTGDIEMDWMVKPGGSVVLTNPDGSIALFGSDWGIQVNQSCVMTLGEAAAWQPYEYTLHWDGDSLRAGPGNPPAP